MERLFALILSIPHLVREECRDHAFGDAEIFISFNGEEVGGGYFGGGDASLWIFDVSLRGAEARFIRNQIPLGAVDRNDETGPDTFSLGVTMPGLTLEGVRQELTS